MTGALYARHASHPLVLPVVGRIRSRSALAASLVTYSSGTKRSDTSSILALVPYAKGVNAVPRVGDLTMMAVYSTAIPAVTQSLAWQFTMDGHTFYVLDLGSQGTFLYDIISQNWCKYETNGLPIWNFRNGSMWFTGAPNEPTVAARVVGGDLSGPYIWELDPLAILDDDFRDIPHAASAAIALRSRVYHSMAELRIAASAGLLDETDGAAFIQLTYSDDGGQTYSAPVIVVLQVGDTPDGQQDIRFSSLGSFMAPGRILQLADVGGTLRLDGIDAMMDDFDETNGPLQPQG